MTDVAVLGAGAFGTALAVSLARSGRKVSLVPRSQAHVDAMMSKRENDSRLPGVNLPDGLIPTCDVPSKPCVVLAVIPTQQLGSVLSLHAEVLSNKTIVTCNKGIDLKTGQGPTALVQSHVQGVPVAALSGPGFAHDIARGLPTALTLACDDKDLGGVLQTTLATENLRLYRTTDVAGVELGGAVKNVMAIAAGLVIGSGLGESARAALITRGFAELTRFAVGRGARQETLAGLSGLGDLILTCTSERSRNYTHGLCLGRDGATPTGKTVEGVSTAQILAEIATKEGVDLPITQTVDAILNKKITVREAQAQLFARPMREE